MTSLPGLTKFNILFLNILLVLIGIILNSGFTRLNNIYIYIYIEDILSLEVKTTGDLPNYLCSFLTFWKLINYSDSTIKLTKTKNSLNGSASRVTKERSQRPVSAIRQTFHCRVFFDQFVNTQLLKSRLAEEEKGVQGRRNRKRVVFL